MSEEEQEIRSEYSDDRLDRVIMVLERIAREVTTTRQLTSKFVNAMEQAEVEIPESARRFVTYMHDIHDISYMYEERGIPVPDWIFREMERCDDRYRQILKTLHTDTGAFEKIRREMAQDPENKWDHTRLLFKPKENGDETGKR